MSAEYKVSRPYARAIFELAFEKNNMQMWSEMLRSAKCIVENEVVHSMLKNPVYSSDEIVQMILDIAGEDFTQECQNLVYTLAHFKRLLLMPQICEQYDAFRAEAEKIVDVELTSAFPVSAQDQERFKQSLKKKLQRDIALECQEDSSILAGAIIRSGDLLIDGSLRGKLAKLGDAMGVF
jgi:F-type H+-transporting ATPase subunit delta